VELFRSKHAIKPCLRLLLLDLTILCATVLSSVVIVNLYSRLSQTYGPVWLLPLTILVCNGICFLLILNRTKVTSSNRKNAIVVLLCVEMLLCVGFFYYHIFHAPVFAFNGAVPLLCIFLQNFYMLIDRKRV